jgi:hypothetical protein
MALSVIVLIGLCLISAIVLGAGGVIAVVYFSGQRDKSNNPLE